MLEAVWVLVLLLLYWRRRHLAYVLIGATVAVLALEQLIQVFYATPRPFVVFGIAPLIPHAPTPSFFSTHASVSFVIALTMWRYDPRWGIFFILWAVLVSLSRVYAFLHFPIDVMVGAATGTLVVLAWR